MYRRSGYDDPKVTREAPTLELIHQQHEELYRKFRSLANQLQIGNSPRCELTAAFDDLHRFVLVHFETEELLMDETGYPEIEAHRWQHHYVARNLAAIQTALNAGAEYSPQDQHQVREMVEHHTQETDFPFLVYNKRHASAGA